MRILKKINEDEEEEEGERARERYVIYETTYSSAKLQLPLYISLFFSLLSMSYWCKIKKTPQYYFYVIEKIKKHQKGKQFAVDLRKEKKETGNQLVRS